MKNWKINPAWEDAPYDPSWIFKTPLTNPMSNIIDGIQKTICIDFDGVIHSFVQPWISATVIPDPAVYGAFDFIKRCIADGYTVAVFSSRSHQFRGIDAMKAWFIEHGLDETTLQQIQFPQEKPPAIIYIDDRGYRFIGEWPTAHFLETFRPWNRADDAK